MDPRFFQRAEQVLGAPPVAEVGQIQFAGTLAPPDFAMIQN
jgi:hypothetical protein